MNEHVRKFERRGDDIDRIVDSLVDDPARAASVKAAVRESLFGRRVVRFTESRPSVRESVEEMWDNVPV